MAICVVMQYLRTGLLSNQSIAGLDDTNNAYVWIIPPIVFIVGVLIGIV